LLRITLTASCFPLSKSISVVSALNLLEAMADYFWNKNKAHPDLVGKIKELLKIKSA
jgi:hypothetical protein